MSGWYQTYPEYKESGVEWLGEVPKHWVTQSIKRLTLVKRGASPRPIDDPKYFDEKGHYAWVRIADVTSAKGVLERTTQSLSKLGSSLSVPLEPGDLFLSIAGTVGQPCITQIPACIHDGFVYFPGFRGSKKYLYYMFAAGECYKGLGKFGTQLNLNTDTVGFIKIGLPSLKEQHQIARYLDHETARIDLLIAKQEQLIELLKEKRQAVISHAVTKGLDPDVPMKDSGVEWLGEVPEHWDVLPIRRVVAGIEQGSSPIAEDRHPNASELGVLKISSVKNGKFLPEASKTLSTGEEFDSRFEINAGDLLLTRANTPKLVADACLIKKAPLYRLMMCDLIYRLNYTNEIDAGFLCYWLTSNPGRVQIEMDARGSSMTMAKVSQGHILSWILPKPSKKEQAQIVNYLDQSCSEMDLAEEKCGHLVALAKERRTALISAAVTGKIDVRTWQPPNGTENARIPTTSTP
ncbi:restriction endonuclease subunit S [bacterium endosymbiont of Escarpia laminata]|nr:MAG: restriction endonuclease subunit S [bacterium endosymbiont of Escarpia laminata]